MLNYKLTGPSFWAVLTVLAPFILAIVIFFFRIETRLTRIETDITWIKQSYKQCQPSSEKVTR